MDIIGGALPNVMFIVGIIAIGIGLGLEFKIIEVKGQLSRLSRVVTATVGMLLILGSIGLYLQPALSSSTATPASTAPALSLATQPSTISQQSSAAPAAVASSIAAEAPSPIVVTVMSTADTRVTVPDLRGQNTKDAERALRELGLRLGEKGESCADLAVPPELIIEADKGRVSCQIPAPGTAVAPGSVVQYAVSDKK